MIGTQGPPLQSQLGVELAPFTTLRVGGTARAFVETDSDDDLIETVRHCDAADDPVLLLAGGSNVLIGDDGFDGTVIRVQTRGVEVVEDDEQVLVTAAAGESWDRLVARSVADGWSGIESLSGIPGSVGATPIQNVGAYGNEVADTIHSVAVFDRWSSDRVVLSAEECGFAYRNSKFKLSRDRWVILSVTLRLGKRAAVVPVKYADLAKRLGLALGDVASPAQIRRAVLDVRRSKGMVLNIDDFDTWSVGSFFTNPIVTPEVAAAVPEAAPRWPTEGGMIKLSAAWLIENAGFSPGYPGTDATASLSTKHTLALTNRGKAKARDVLKIAREVHDGVAEFSGIRLQPEPVLVNCQI